MLTGLEISKKRGNLPFFIYYVKKAFFESSEEEVEVAFLESLFVDYLFCCF
ncbi:hypothetical protein D931_01096 [Enterococcus faecium 13.SD.W.09]|nr:hypothetical protein D931_01096 [Enterococcus faecium 13.SD.W.09]